MPPKRGPKRRQDEDGSGRPGKKSAKNKREVTYDTSEEAMDGGVELEEKGERYRDGDKAQRFYERALDLYKKAYDFEATFDAAYNQSRVLYTLGSSFFLPPTSLSYLSTSIGLARHAITLTESKVLQLDAAHNLAQATIDMADIIEDIHSDRGEQVMQLRNEAREILEGVLVAQEEYVASTAEELEVDQASAAAEDSDMAEAVGSAGDGAAGGDAGMEVDPNKDDDMATTYETFVPTPSSLVDTALILVDLHLTMWEAVEPLAPPTDAQQAAVRSILDRVSGVTPPGRQAEIDLLEIKVLLTMDEIVWDVYKAEASLGTGIEKSLEGAIGALTSLLASLDTLPPDEPTVRGDVLLSLASTHLSTAYRLLFLTPQLPPGPSPLAQAAWYHLSQAVSHLNTAVELPTNASTPKSYRPSLLLLLSRASLSRAKLGSLNETAKRNAKQLIDNATTYATRAIEAVGWAPVLGLASSSLSIGSKPAPPWQSGWDAEILAKSIVLQHLRISHVIASSELLPESKEIYENKGKNLVERVKGIQDAERRISAADVSRWVEEIEDVEGGMGEGEKAWWVSVGRELGSVVH